MERTMNLTKASLCADLVFGGVAASHASSFQIVKPTGATASSSPSGFVQYQSINKIIDGSGLSTSLNTGDPGPVVWPTHSVNQSDLWVADAFDSFPPAGNPLTWTVTLTLGSVYHLTGFHLWNENELEANRSSSNYTVSVSTDGSSYTPITASPTPFLASPPSSSYQGDEYSFTSPVSASFVRFAITSNYGAQYVGLSEIRFEAIPEPSTILLFGLGGLLVWRRARKCRM